MERTHQLVTILVRCWSWSIRQICTQLWSSPSKKKCWLPFGIQGRGKCEHMKFISSLQSGNFWFFGRTSTPSIIWGMSLWSLPKQNMSSCLILILSQEPTPIQCSKKLPLIYWPQNSKSTQYTLKVLNIRKARAWYKLFISKFKNGFFTLFM